MLMYGTVILTPVLKKCLMFLNCIFKLGWEWKIRCGHIFQKLYIKNVYIINIDDWFTALCRYFHELFREFRTDFRK